MNDRTLNRAALFDPLVFIFIFFGVEVYGANKDYQSPAASQAAQAYLKAYLEADNELLSEEDFIANLNGLGFSICLSCEGGKVERKESFLFNVDITEQLTHMRESLEEAAALRKFKEERRREYK